MAGIYKAYDIRGLYPQQLNEETAEKIGLALANFIGEGKKIVITRDMRVSGESVSKAFIKGAISGGCDITNAGLSTTPMNYFITNKYSFDSGVMTTASHNPGNYNGFKLSKEKAIPISYDTGINKIEEMINNNQLKISSRKGIVKENNYKSNYIEYLLRFVENIKPLKIIIDAGNGMAGYIYDDLFKNLPLEIEKMYFEPDGNFPNHVPNPLKYENVKELCKRVKETGADLGISFDGDVDRCAFIDNNGNPIRSDLITVLLARNFLSKNPRGKIIYDLRSSWVVKEEIEKAGGVPIMYRVGHAFIKTKLREENALFAGELSGHYYFSDNFFTDSGIVAFIKLINYLSNQNQKLSELIEPLQKYDASGEINFKIENSENALKEITNYYKKYNPKNIYHLDGLSIEFDNWWFNIRPSNTEPLIRLNLETTEKGKINNYLDEIKNLISKLGGIQE